MTFKEFFSFRVNKAFWINILVMVVLAIATGFGVMKWLDVYTHHGEAVVVPDVKGMTVDEATQLFHNSKLECVVSDSTYVKKQPAGVILDVTPAVGQRVKEGRTIYLTINTLSSPLRTVPDVADNSSLRQAQARVLAAGFKLNEEEWISGEKEWVYEVKYKGRSLVAGEEIPLGATLTLVVGDGTSELESDSLGTDSLDLIIPETSASQEEDSWF